MTDELTPEERQAFDSLPRERMPAAGLEGRVVDAMRGHGYLAKKRRVLELSGGRVAGVLAAGVALLIGAYSIGLHRGGEVPTMPSTTVVRENAPTNEVGSLQAAAQEKNEIPAVSESPASGVAREAEPPATRESERKDINEPKLQKAAPPADRPEAATEEPVTLERDAVAPAEKKREPVPSTTQPRAPSAALRESAGRTESMFDARANMAVEMPNQTLTFLLNGTPVTVEADSSRVVEDERGRFLLIYTRHGIFRIPLADE
jgi:hypothetical protein